MSQRHKHPDKKNASSILDASLRQMEYTLTLEPNEISAFNIIRNIYECFRMLGDALLVSQGKFSEEHIEQIRVLENLKISTERPLKLINNLRRMRHQINYYGYTPQKIEADDAILLAKTCFEPLLKTVKKEIENSELFKRMKKQV